MIRLFYVFIFTLCTSFLFAQTQVEFIEIASDFDSPVDVLHAGDNFLFVVEKEGYIYVLSTDGTNLGMVLDIKDRVNSSANEQGLLGAVFHPKFPDSAYLYVNYINDDGNTVVSRFTMAPSGSITVDPSTEKEILVVEQPFDNHNAGDLEFGPDGYLYIPLGDGGNGGDPQNNSQNRLKLLGKILRIDIDNGDPYSIPADNPFVSDDFTLDEIWAIGLRNPWRIDFDPENGDLYIADVGQNAMEEINVEAASSDGGENYGWRCYEGTMPFNQTDCNAPVYTEPVYAYNHNAGSFCRASISGGAVYRGTEFPNLTGKYFFADYCSGMVGAIYRDQNDEWQMDTVAQYDPFDVVSISRHSDGELYMVTLGSGRILKIKEKNTGTNTLQSQESFVLQNPVSDVLVIKSDRAIQGGALIDATGRLVLQFSPDQFEYSTATLPDGMYMVVIEVDDQVINEKVLISH